MLSLGETIRAARKEANLTMVELADKTDLTQGYLSKIENNKKIPAHDVLKKFSELLEVPYLDLMAKAGYIDFESAEKINDFEFDEFSEELKSMTLGEIIKYAREQNEISLSDLAAKLNVTESFLTQLENNIAVNPSISFMVELANTLDVPFAFLQLLSEVETEHFDIGIPKDLIYQVGMFKYSELIESESFEEFYEKQLEEDLDDTNIINFSKELYDELLLMKKIENLFRLQALFSVSSSSIEIKGLLKQNFIPISYQNRKLSQNDIEKILSKIEEMKDEFEYQD